MAHTSYPAYDTGEYLAANGSGTVDDPFVPLWTAAGSITGSFRLFGTGAWFAAGSGSGTKDDPYVPYVSLDVAEFSSAFSTDFRTQKTIQGDFSTAFSTAFR